MGTGWKPIYFTPSRVTTVPRMTWSISRRSGEQCSCYQFTSANPWPRGSGEPRYAPSSFPPVRIIARELTFFCNMAGLRIRQFFPQDKIQGTISSSELSVSLTSKVPSANSWILWLGCQFRSRTSCAARPEKHKTILRSFASSLCQI
jgi:hypothetical protein